MRTVGKLGGWTGMLCLAVLAGCGSKGALPTYPVSGKVEFEEGGPLTTGEVVFTSEKVTSRGMIKSDGSYQLSTYGDGDGAPVGSYKVAILGASLSKATPENPYATEALVDPKFTDAAQSGLTHTVETKASTYDFKVTKPAK